jgi:hypothetical protein
MWASSCRRIPSICEQGKPVSRPTGIRITGFRCPITTGTSAMLDSRSATERVTLRFAASWLRRVCHAPAGAQTPTRRNRHTATQPPKARTWKSTIPMSQTRAIHLGSATPAALPGPNANVPAPAPVGTACKIGVPLSMNRPAGTKCTSVIANAARVADSPAHAAR